MNSNGFIGTWPLFTLGSELHSLLVEHIASTQNKWSVTTDDIANTELSSVEKHFQENRNEKKFRPVFYKFESRLKSALIFCDKIYIPYDATINSWKREISFVLNISQKEFDNIFISVDKDIGQDSLDSLTTTLTKNELKSFQSKVYATNRENYNLSRYKLPNKAQHLKDIGAIFSESISNALIWGNIVNTTECKFIAFQDHELIPAKGLLKKSSELDLNFSEYKSLIPNFGSLSWRDIHDLRKEKQIINFRNVISKNNLNSEKELAEHIIDDLWDIARSANKNIASEVFMGIGTNIPLPFPNPIGIFDSVNGIRKSIKFKTDYSYLLFLMDLQKKI